MGNIWDCVPIISQAKSLVISLGRSTKYLEQAGKVQERFLRCMPIVSQINSLGHAIVGNEEGAREIQEEFTENVLEPLPVVGHVIGAVYMATNRTERGKAVMLGATKSTLVLASAACGPASTACAGAPPTTLQLFLPA